MTRLLGLALVAAIAAGVWSYGCERNRNGKLEGELIPLRKQYDSLEWEHNLLAAQQPKLDTVYLVRVKWMARTRAATDSTLAADTTPVPRPEVRAIVATERASCDAVVLACEAQKSNLLALTATLSRQNGNLQHQVSLERKKRPGLFAGLLTKVLWAGIGFGAGRLF